MTTPSGYLKTCRMKLSHTKDNDSKFSFEEPDTKHELPVPTYLKIKQSKLLLFCLHMTHWTKKRTGYPMNEKPLPARGLTALNKEIWCSVNTTVLPSA